MQRLTCCQLLCDVGCGASLSELLDSYGDLDSVTNLVTQKEADLAMVIMRTRVLYTHTLHTHFFQSLLIDIQYHVAAYIVICEGESMGTATIIGEPLSNMVITP